MPLDNENIDVDVDPDSNANDLIGLSGDGDNSP